MKKWSFAYLRVAFRNFVRFQRMKLSIRWAEKYGFSVVRMRERAGTCYIVDGSGNWLKIGRAENGAKIRVVKK